MIEFEKLSELTGSARFGCCNLCGIGSKETDSLVRIRFEQCSIVLCKEHMKEFREKLQKLEE